MRFDPQRLDPESYPGPGLDLPVFFGDLDPNGHLNNVAFGRFFEHARVVSHGEHGIRGLLAETGTHFLVARVCIDYLREGRLGSPLHVRSRVERVGRTSFVEHQAAWQLGQCIALAEIVVVHVEDSVPVPVPDRVRTALEGLTRAAPGAP